MGFNKRPLTPDELRMMDGKPVWVEFTDGSGGLWGLVHISIFEQICFTNGLQCTIGSPYYGKTYKVYSSEPHLIDRKAWEPCERCKQAECQTDYFCTHDFQIAENNICFYDDSYGEWQREEINFCPWCGRPLTNAAWEKIGGQLQ